jgi:hypothetical protein
MSGKSCCSFIILGALCGCGSGPVVKEPRCAEICLNTPETDGAWSVCNTKSTEECLRSCAARIENVSGACATCLLEYARVEMSETYSSNQFCAGEKDAKGHELVLDTSGGGCAADYCHLQSCDDGTYCVYCDGDRASREECERKLFPRREVGCLVHFRPSNQCYLMCD